LINRVSKYHYQAKIQTAPETLNHAPASALEPALKHYFGYIARPGQRQIVEQALQNQLIIMPTGGENPVFNCQHC